MKSYLVDSSVILEALKGNPRAKDILKSLGENPKFINSVIFSGVLFIFLKNITGKSYLSLRGNKKEFLKHREKISKLYRFLRENFVEVPLTEEISDMAFELMTKHALLPNDSLILATAKFYGLTLVTLDSDFEEPAKAEEISLFGGEADG
ncbi:type II toxin-antitoxin system VapC family toxin [Thermococcus gorgonarius]|uniref:Nucleotide-binding protein n=1 Tax=Thermococcus gorgonarius TaxID=71997 RepID=A0A2Z2MEH9_THEGO|nr:type II toxin-antitoxin system VapC family toxin [Thermococcus gorgonarius]ASJ00418.1 nucleotide-binding protein [Thermococcus gorgonarius]